MRFELPVHGSAIMYCGTRAFWRWCLILFLMTTGLSAHSAAITDTWQVAKSMERFEEIALEQGDEKQFVVLFFCAAWSTYCGRVHPELIVDQSEFKHYTFIEVDLTAWNDHGKRISDRYNIQGVPSLVLCDRSLKAIPGKSRAPFNLTLDGFKAWLEASTGDSIGKKSSEHSIFASTRPEANVEMLDADGSIVFDVKPHKGFYLYANRFELLIDEIEIKFNALVIDGTVARINDGVFGNIDVYTDPLKIHLSKGVLRLYGCKGKGELTLRMQGSSVEQILLTPSRSKYVVTC